MIGFPVLFLSVATAAPVEPPMPVIRATLSKSVDSFEDCFVRSQERAGRPWGFVPTASGGAFTNLGARAANSPYRLLVRAGQGAGSLRLIAQAPDADLVAAVETCR